MLPEANEVCVARREAHEPLLVLDHGVEEVADGEVPAVRRPEDLSRTIIAGDQDNRGPVVSDEAVEFVAAQGRGAPPLEPALVKLRVARGEVAVRLLTGGAERVSALEISPVVPHEFSNTPIQLKAARDSPGRRSSERRPGVRSAAARQAWQTGRADP